MKIRLLLLLSALTIILPLQVLGIEKTYNLDKMIKGLHPTKSIICLVDTGEIIKSTQEAKGRQYTTIKVYHRGNIKITVYEISENRVISYSTKSTYTYPPYKIVHMHTDNKQFIDRINSQGKNGADGIFDEILPR